MRMSTLISHRFPIKNNLLSNFSESPLRRTMSQNLSTHGFKWMTPEEVKKWNDVPHYVEVDIEYHQE